MAVCHQRLSALALQQIPEARGHVVPRWHAVFSPVLAVKRPTEQHGVRDSVEHDHERARDHRRDQGRCARDPLRRRDKLLRLGVLKHVQRVQQQPGQVSAKAGDGDEPSSHEELQRDAQHANRRDLIREDAKGDLRRVAEGLRLYGRDDVGILIHEADEALKAGHAAATAPSKDLGNAARACLLFRILYPLVNHRKDKVDSL
mmetsp:Transcript_77643/g.214564  ORF Transcript_77643/g.214564 Transcript_77643/m.214564 type:complete len:202 (+) Transcript_77643:117-722(+)